MGLWRFAGSDAGQAPERESDWLAVLDLREDDAVAVHGSTHDGVGLQAGMLRVDVPAHDPAGMDADDVRAEALL